MHILTRDEITEIACDEVLFLGSDKREFDRAIMGMMTRPGSDNSVLVYDVDLIMEILVEQGLDEEDAEEWYSYNIAGAYMGEYTPLYMHRIALECPKKPLAGTETLPNIIPFPAK